MPRLSTVAVLASPLLIAGFFNTDRSIQADEEAFRVRMQTLQNARTAFTLHEIEGQFVAFKSTPPAAWDVPFDFVILRRTIGTTSTDCGSFGRPAIRDDGITRLWIYSMVRPRTGACVATVGARFVAAGRKGIVESVTPSVP